MNKQLTLTEVTIGRFTFNLSESKDSFDCRGEMMWDDEHDEMPEPALWTAAHKLKIMLERDGFKNVTYNHSEKGWVEVSFS